jgi:hypothetical protein
MCYPRSDPGRTYTDSETQNVHKKAASLSKSRDAATAEAVWGTPRLQSMTLSGGRRTNIIVGIGDPETLNGLDADGRQSDFSSY